MTYKQKEGGNDVRQLQSNPSIQEDIIGKSKKLKYAVPATSS